MQAVRVSRNTPTTFRSVRFACTDAGQSMRQNLEGIKQFRRPVFGGFTPTEAANLAFGCRCDRIPAANPPWHGTCSTKIECRGACSSLMTFQIS